MKVIPARIALALFVVAGSAQADFSDEEALALSYGDKTMVSITTGMAQPINRAPAVATVITADDIEAIGATDLDEVLETVPGLHVSHSTLGYAPIYMIRGIASQYNPQVLMLTNGIPMTSVLAGDRGTVWGGLPVENIARIEIIRGPGSALYGADAFAGVINIVTKNAGNIDGTQVGVRYGSFSTRDAWLLHGGEIDGMQVAAYLRVGDTDGAKEPVPADAQTRLDALFGTNASYAPGVTNLGRRMLDGSLDIARDKWRFRIALKRRSDGENATGLAQALDPAGRSFSQRVTSDLTWQDRNFAQDLDLTVQGSYYYLNEKSDLVLFPPGATFPTGTFPDGMIGNPYLWERRFLFSVSAFYTGFGNQRIRIGAGRGNDSLYRVRESRNYTYTYIPGVGNLPTPLGSVVDVSGSGAFMSPHSRSNNYLYVQDEWSFARDWTLTGGIRHDDYSDFGGTTNPRLALIWDAGYNVTAKLLAGRAFRTPSFQELYNINNPVATGNPDLKPETISTAEAAVSWQPVSSLQLGANIFHYKMRDILRFVPNADPTTGSTAQNTGSQAGHGLELEASWDASKTVRLSGNYGYQRSTDKATSRDAGDAPHHHLYMRGDWRFMPDWTANAQLNWVIGRDRIAGDPRPNVPDYRTLDLTLRKGNARYGSWDVAVSIRNLFDATVLEPSPAPGSIPYDFPLARRSAYIQLRYGL
ncbi:TonB-dependent receptor plug domain-containing protein [Sterolibacterium denitrificans]|nr:TonB-dependent receptor [Sterolibacterium denitrificans]